MLDDDPELEEAMAALPLEQLESNFARQQQQQQQTAPRPFVPSSPATHNALPVPSATPHPSTSSPTYLTLSAPRPLPPPHSRSSLVPPPHPPLRPPLPASHTPPVVLPASVASTFPTDATPPPAFIVPLPRLLCEWQHLQADWRCGEPTLLNDPYEVCHAIVKQLKDDIDDEKTAAATTHTADSNGSTKPMSGPPEAQKQLCSVYCQLMTLLDLPSSSFAPSPLSSLRSPPQYEPALLHHLACIAHNTALQTDDWSMASYFCHFALQLFTLPDVPLPSDTPNCLSSLSQYLIALLDEVAAREAATVHAVYGEAMLRVLQENRRREAESGSSGFDHGLADMLELQARMYIASGRREWAEEARKKQKAERKDSKKRKHKSQRKLAHSQQWQQAAQHELDDIRQRLLTLLAQRTLSVNKCTQLLAVAFQLRLVALQRPLAEHVVCHTSAQSSVDWQLHYVELLCMLSSDEELFVFASLALSSPSFPSLHFRCWQYLCERCWTAGTVLVRGGPSELGEKLLAVGIRLLERACQCNPKERVGSQMDEQQVLPQLSSVLDYVRERDKRQQQVETSSE